MMKRCYTFSVYITAEEATDDGNGWTPKEIEQLLKTTLNYYSAPLNREHMPVDYELMSSEEVPNGR
jgi:hypothetical protein